MTVRELLARIDSRELAEWMAYYRTEPFGGCRGDLQAGVIASTIANVNKAKRGKAFSPGDFMPLMKKPKQTEDEMINIMNAMAREK